MPMAPAARPMKNHLLAALPQKEYKRLLPHLKLVSLGVKEVLQEPYQPIKYLYFPINGLITKIVSTEDGATVEVGMVGKEGMTGNCLFMGSRTSPFRTVVQIPGEARRLEAIVFQAGVGRNWAWTDLLLDYS
jgi:CRP-like cAMP-binding protein